MPYNSTRMEEEPSSPDHQPSTFSWFSSSPNDGQQYQQEDSRILTSSSVESVPLHRRRHEREDQLSEFSVTPMTSRPHNCSFASYTSPVGPPIRRVRSRSLGQVADLQSKLPSLLLPPITVHTNTIIDDHHKQNKNANGDTQQAPPPEAAAPAPVPEPTSVHISILYGMINATIVLPVLMSFSSIIYRDNAFDPFIPILVKLTVVSGIVHQLCFSTFSSLPFAVGQGMMMCQ